MMECAAGGIVHEMDMVPPVCIYAYVHVLGRRWFRSRFVSSTLFILAELGT